MQAGKAEALYRRPAELFVARLFSEINEIPMRVKGGALDTPDRASLPCRASTRATRRSCASAAAPSVWGRRARACPAACCTPASWAISAVLEIAAQGFERPLLTLVREWEVPERGAEVSIAVDPESVLVFPAEGRAEKRLMPEAWNREIQAFKTRQGRCGKLARASRLSAIVPSQMRKCGGCGCKKER